MEDRFRATALAQIRYCGKKLSLYSDSLQAISKEVVLFIEILGQSIEQ